MTPMLLLEHIDALNEVGRIVHENAKAKGFHDFTENEGQFITRSMLLINTETAELYEAHRNGVLTQPCDKSDRMVAPLTCEQEEIADVIIRALDYAQRRNINVGRAVAVKHAYNTTREFKHGNKAA